MVMNTGYDATSNEDRLMNGVVGDAGNNNHNADFADMAGCFVVHVNMEPETHSIEMDRWVDSMELAQPDHQCHSRPCLKSLDRMAGSGDRLGQVGNCSKLVAEDSKLVVKGNNHCSDSEHSLVAADSSVSR